MVTEQQNSFIDSLDGIPTPEQAAQLLELTTAQGETAKAETGQPAAGATDVTAIDEAGKQIDTDDLAGLTADNAIILAKDGKHTISFEKLEAARQSAQHYKQQAETALGELERLKVEAQARAATGQQATLVDNQVATAQAAIDAGADPALFGDFSEEALHAGILKLVKSEVNTRVGDVIAKLEPIQQQQEKAAADEHYSAIYQAHPDADSIVESKELAEWIQSQPSFVRESYAGVLNKGTTAEVIELFNQFKQAVNKAPGEVSAESAQAKAKEAVARAKPAAPFSLSDIPGGKTGAADRDAAIANMTGPEMLDEVGNYTPQQLEAFLNRSL